MSRRKSGGFVGLLFIGGMGYALWYFIKGKGAGITTAAKSMTVDTSSTAPAELPQAPPPIYLPPQLVQVAPPASQPAPTTTTPAPAPAPAPQLVQVAPPASQPTTTTTTTATTSSTAPCAAKPGDILIRACETGPLTRADLERLGTFRRYNLDGSQDGNGWNIRFSNAAAQVYNQETGAKVYQKLVPDNAGVASKVSQYVAHRKAGTLASLK